MNLILPINERSRKYCYIIWNKKKDYEVKKILGDREQVKVYFNDSFIGVKNIDWKFRRISVGYSKTRKMPNNTTEFLIQTDRNGTLRISWQ